MKIAMIVHDFPCISETFILSQITGMVSRGHEVHIYADGRGETSNIETAIENGASAGTRTFFWNEGEWGIPLNKFLRLIKAFGIARKMGFKGMLVLLPSFNFIKYGKAAATLSLFYESAAFMRNGPYHIVHGHFGQNGLKAIALKDVGVIKGKVITTFYGFDISEYVKLHGSSIYDSLFSQGDRFVAISESMRDQLLRLGCRKDKIIVHRLGVDMSRFTFDPGQTKTSAKLRLLTIGRFVEKKGIEFGIRAVALAVKKYPLLTYHIVGDGELKDEITQLIAQLNVGKHIKLMGWRSPEEVTQLMGESDIFLAPSVTSINGDQEGTPTVIIEALARGLPVLSTNHAGIPELVQDGRSGFLVPERDPIVLAEKVEYLCKHPEKCLEMSRVGRDWVERHHDIEMLNNQLVVNYERLLQEEIS